MKEISFHPEDGRGLGLTSKKHGRSRNPRNLYKVLGYVLEEPEG